MKTITRLAFLALVLAALPLAAQTNYDWSMVGATGTITNPATGYNYTGPTFEFAPFFKGNITARYRVTNTYGSATSKTPPWTTLIASVTDNSASASVTTRLLQVDKCNSTETQICSITSSDGTDPHCDTCTFSSGTIDFANYEYYVEVKLTRSLTTVTAALHSVAIN